MYRQSAELVAIGPLAAESFLKPAALEKSTSPRSNLLNEASSPASHSAQIQPMSFATLQAGFGPPPPLLQNQLPLVQGQADILMLDHGVELAGPVPAQVKGSHLVSLQSSATPVISGMPADGFSLSKMAPATGGHSSNTGLQFSDASLAGKILEPKRTSSMDQKSSFAMQVASTISSSNSQSVR